MHVHLQRTAWGHLRAVLGSGTSPGFLSGVCDTYLCSGLGVVGSIPARFGSNLHRPGVARTLRAVERGCQGSGALGTRHRHIVGPTRWDLAVSLTPGIRASLKSSAAWIWLPAALGATAGPVEAFRLFRIQL